MNHAAKCHIGDTRITVNYDNKKITDYLEPFLAAFDTEDISLFVDDVPAPDKKHIDSKHQRFFEEHYPLLLLFKELEEALPTVDAVVLHAGVFRVDNRGIAFVAPSGTGKTTQMLLWKRLLGDRMKIVDYDKPIIKAEADSLIAYRSPWVSTEGNSEEDHTQLSDICMIRRGEENGTDRLSKAEGKRLLSEYIHCSEDPDVYRKQLEMLDLISQKADFWMITCNTEVDSAEKAYNTISKKRVKK